MASSSRESALARRDLFTGRLLLDFLRPVVATAATATSAGKLASALGTVFPENAGRPAAAAAPIPVRCPW
jgi:hypothetical protein